jgi:WD40 repeat protein
MAPRASHIFRASRGTKPAIKLGIAAVIVFTAGLLWSGSMAIISPVAAEELEYDKSIFIGDEPVHLAWSRDSRNVAVWASHGTISVMDVESGSMRRIPNSMHAVESLAWSNDGRFIAIDNGPELRILDVHTYAEIFHLNASQADIRFGGPIIFSSDNMSLLVVSSAPHSALLYRIDLKTSDVTTAIALPSVPGARSFAKNGRIIRNDGKSFLSIVVTSYQRETPPKLSCHIFNLTTSSLSEQSVSINRRVIARSDGVTPLARTINVGGCNYIPNVDSVAVWRDAIAFAEQPPPHSVLQDFVSDPIFRAADRDIEVIDLSSKESVANFVGSATHDGDTADFDTHPNKPLIVASVVHAHSKLSPAVSVIRLFDSRNGHQVASVEAPPSIWKVRFSPDGNRIAVISGSAVRIYRVR